MTNETQIEVSDVLQDMMAQADVAAAYRDLSIPEGALIGEAVGPAGEQVKWKKQSSMVKAGNTPLPERFEAYDRNGGLSLLPTAQMSRMLSKTRADDATARAFHTHTRGLTRATCQICPEPKTPIAQTCEFCKERNGGKAVKVFYKESDLLAHERYFHPLESESRDATIERAERRADREAQKQIADAMVALAQNNTPAVRKRKADASADATEE